MAMTVMDREREMAVERSVPKAGIALLVAGLVVVAGGLLSWFQVPSGAIGFDGGAVQASYSGLDAGALGIAALIAGASVAIAGLAAIAWRTRRVPAIVGVVGGVVAVGVGLFVLTRLSNAFVDVAASRASNESLPAGKIDDLLTRLIDAGQVSVDPGLGLYLVAAGGLAALILGLVGVFRSPPREAVHAGTFEAPAFRVPGDDPPEPGLSTDR